MEGRRKEKPRPQDPEEGPLRLEVPECRPGHDREHERRGQDPGRHRPRENGFEEGEDSLVRPPVPRIGRQARPETGARLGVRQVEEDQQRHARRRQAPSVTAREHRQGGDGRELGEGGEGERRTHRPRHPGSRPGMPAGHAGRARIRGAGHRIGAGPGNLTSARLVWRNARRTDPARGHGEQEQDREEENAERLEVSAPGRLDHHQGRPGEEDQGCGNGAAGPAGHRRQQQAGPQVGERPQRLERDHRSARERARREDHLGEGGVDGGDGRIVDARVPRGSDRLEFRRVRRVQVGVDPLELHMPVPQIAVDVVGEKRSAGE